MRVLVEERGYADAVDSFVGANHLVARAGEQLRGSLSSCAGMAGDDSTATEFAASYDEAAASCVATVADLVSALGSVAHLTEASSGNHRTADARSGGYAVSGPPDRADHCVGLALTAPPSSLGADSGGPGGVAGVVFDHIADVVWPNADTDRVRVAAATWRTAATSVRLVTAHCNTALAGLDAEVSPEIPIAVSVTQDLSARVDDLADQLTGLATACDTYADQVDAKRDDMLGLLRDLAVDLGIGAVIAGGLSFLSAGLAGPAAGAAGSARLAAAARELKGIVDALRLATGSTALEVRTVPAVASESGGFFSKLSGARVLAMDIGEGAPRSTGSLFAHLRPGWLSKHEGVGHTLDRHVGKTIDELRERLVRERRRTAVSTFRTQDEAESAIKATLKANESEIRRWLSHAEGSEAFRTHLRYDVGDVLVRGAEGLVPTKNVKVVLIPDGKMAARWRLLTAHPEL